HAADWAGPRALLPHLRMHRAGEDGPRRYRRGRREGGWIEIFCWVGGEFASATARAEEIALAAMDVAMRRRGRIDRHAADGILGSAGCRERGHAGVHPYHLVTDEKN